MCLFKKKYKRYFGKIIIVDPLEDDLFDHVLYLESYKEWCKIYKIDPKDVYIMCENSIAYSLSQLLSLKDIQNPEVRKKQALRMSFDTSPITWITDALVIVNEKRENWIPGNYSNIKYHISRGLGYTHREVRCVIPSSFGSTGVQFESMKSHNCRFAVCRNVPIVPGHTYVDYLDRNFKEILKMIKKKGF